jgi:hypothetical protein
MTPRYFALTFAIATIALTTSRRADAQHFDILLARPATGTTTVIGGADVDALTYDDVLRVFESEMGSAGGEFLSLEPGVNHPNINDPGLTAYPAAAAALLPGDVLRLVERDFTVAGNVDDLFYWNGVDPVSFAPAAANFRIDGGDPLGSVAGAGGAFDDHPFLVVDSNALPGIYLASVVGRADGFNPSAPVYIVMGTEDLITAEFLGITQAEFNMLTEEQRDEALDEVIEAGVAYVEANVVPEPASFALLAIVVAGGTAVGRRRAKELRNQ